MSGTQIQINQLPAVTTPGSGDAIPVQQQVDGVTRYATLVQLLEGAGPAALATAMLTWLNALPTAPNSSGPAIWWNNSGIITYS